MSNKKKPIILAAFIVLAALLISDTYYHWMRGLTTGNGSNQDANNNGIPDDQEGQVGTLDSLSKGADLDGQDLSNIKGIPMTRYDVDPNGKSDLVHLPTGSMIHIPPHAFLKSDGSVETDPVQLYYREFHTFFDALISGVNMDYEEDNVKYAFETSGMAQMEARSKNGVLGVNPDAIIRVDLITNKPQLKSNIYASPRPTAVWVMQDQVSRVYELSDSMLSYYPRPKRPVLFDEVGFSVEDEVGSSPGLDAFSDCYFMPRDGKPHGSSCNHIDVQELNDGGFEVSFEYNVDGKRIWQDQCICDLVVASGYHHSRIDAYLAKHANTVRTYDDWMRQDRRALQQYEEELENWKQLINRNFREIKFLS
ncbi:MAG: hypothetical protein ACKOZY_05410, partial [Flavobacteriales bacterium]